MPQEELERVFVDNTPTEVDISLTNIGSNGIIENPIQEPAKVEAEVVPPVKTQETPPVNDAYDSKEANRLYIAAQREKQEATAMLKEVQEAKSILEAKKNWKDDPEGFVRSVLGETEATDFLDNYIQKKISGKPVDPEVSKTNRKLQELETIVMQKEQAEQETRNQQQAMAFVQSDIVPILNANLEKYEALLAHHNDDVVQAGIEIFNIEFQKYQEQVKSGNTSASPKFDHSVIAENVDKFYQPLIEENLEKHAKIASTKKRFAKWAKEQIQAKVETKSTEIAKPKLPPADYKAPQSKEKSKLLPGDKESRIAAIARMTPEEYAAALQRASR